MSRKYGKAKPMYYRDLWPCGPGGGYPGSFPKGLIPKIKRRWWGNTRLWLFSGGYADPVGITVDIKPEVKPRVIANCEKLPFKDEIFDFIMLDPPYSEEEANRLYGTSYPNMLPVLDEAARVCCPGGFVLLLHRLIPWNHPEHTLHFKRLKVIGIVGVYIFHGWTSIRALMVWQKQNDIHQFDNGC